MFKLLKPEVFSHPILLFGENNLLAIAAEGMGRIFVDQMELDDLRRLKGKLTSGYYPLFVTSDPEVMRVHDFRNQKVGMILCISKSFASMRDSYQ